MSFAELTRNGYLIGDRLYPRVSSILGQLAKPGIEGWKRKIGFEEADRIAKVSTTFGTLVHAGCERVAKGEPVAGVTGDLERGGDLSASQCVEAFGRWLDESVAEVIDTERTVWSERFGYAGTTDLLVQLNDGRMAVCDVKTSKGLSETYRLQLEAYRLALEEQGEPYDARLAIWLPSTHPGTYVVREYADDADRIAWRALLALHRWQAGCRDDWRRDRDALDAPLSNGHARR